MDKYSHHTGGKLFELVGRLMSEITFESVSLKTASSVSPRSKNPPMGRKINSMVGDRGVEPLTSTMSMWRSSQLS